MLALREKKKMMANAFKNKKVLVVGLARSGTGAANLLSDLGAKVTVTDSKLKSELEDQLSRLSPSVKYVSEEGTDKIIDALDLIVISPGVPLYVPLLVKAEIKGIPIIGELELAYQAIQRDVKKSKPVGTCQEFIGVTGTNGKSTVTTLVDLMLKASGFHPMTGGNIGNALTEELVKSGLLDEGEEYKCDYIVAEISSFQLESIHKFRPRIAAILNITPDHLDRYDSIIDYIYAKGRIFENQTADDYLIVNADDPIIMEFYKEKLLSEDRTSPSVLYFSRKDRVDGIYERHGNIYCNLPFSNESPPHSQIFQSSDIRIKGSHNLENVMAASLIALTAGCTKEAVRKTVREFPGLEHRLEFVREFRDVTYINDSKGTNIGSVIKSLESFERVILIMGGIDKGNDFSVLGDLVSSKVKLLVLIGDAQDAIEHAIGGKTETVRADNLADAVSVSASRSSAGDVVLLSPGCASFDMFRDYEDRGRKFKKIVRDIY